MRSRDQDGSIRQIGCVSYEVVNELSFDLDAILSNQESRPDQPPTDKSVSRFYFTPDLHQKIIRKLVLY
jgi:hypothetical protein